MKKVLFFMSFIFLYSCSELIYSGSMDQLYLKKKQFPWKKIQTNEFIIYYLPKSKAEKNIAQIEQKISTALTKAKKVTKIEFYKVPINYFIVDTRKEFNSLTKLNYSGISYSKSNTIIEIYFLIGEAHEIVHLLTHQNWGNSYTWIMEGIAVYSDNYWNGKPLDELCFDLYKNRKLISLKKLTKNSKFNQLDSQISYPQSGSLIKYLIQTYGWEKFLKLWKKPNIRKVYKITIDELENGWISNLTNN